MNKEKIAWLCEHCSNPVNPYFTPIPENVESLFCTQCDEEFDGLECMFIPFTNYDKKTIEDIREECKHTIKWAQPHAPDDQPDHVTRYVIGRLGLAKEILAIIERYGVQDEKVGE